MTHDDGGPEFPVQEWTIYGGTVSFGTAKDHGPEEPDEDGYTLPPYRNGMTIRDEFAKAALTGYAAAMASNEFRELIGKRLGSDESTDDTSIGDILARFSYGYADAMLAERRKRREEGRGMSDKRIWAVKYKTGDLYQQESHEAAVKEAARNNLSFPDDDPFASVVEVDDIRAFEIQRLQRLLVRWDLWRQSLLAPADLVQETHDEIYPP